MRRAEHVARRATPVADLVLVRAIQNPLHERIRSAVPAAFLILTVFASAIAAVSFVSVFLHECKQFWSRSDQSRIDFGCQFSWSFFVWFFFIVFSVFER